MRRAQSSSCASAAARVCERDVVTRYPRARAHAPTPDAVWRRQTDDDGLNATIRTFGVYSIDIDRYRYRCAFDRYRCAFERASIDIDIDRSIDRSRSSGRARRDVKSIDHVERCERGTTHRRARGVFRRGRGVLLRHQRRERVRRCVARRGDGERDEGHRERTLEVHAKDGLRAVLARGE